MRQVHAVALALLVVGGGLAVVVPASATGGQPLEATSDSVLSQNDTHTSESDMPENDTTIEAREPPNLPEQWQQTYGTSGDDMISDLVRTDDGGYLLVGWTETEEGRDGWVIKTDGEGEQRWSKTLGGSGTDRFWGVTHAGEGYLLAGRTDDGGAKGWVVELDSEGDVRDQRTLGPGAFYAVESHESESESESAGSSDYLLAGWTRGDSGTEGWTAKLSGDFSSNDSGNLSVEWQTSYQTPENYDNGYLRAVVTTDSGYYLAGKIEGDSDDAWALRIDTDGGQAWQTAAGGPNRDDVWAAAPGSTEQNASAGFLLAGETESDSTGPRDGWLVKFGAEGAIDWEQRLGGEGTQWLDSAMRTDEGYLLTGSSDAGPKGDVDGYVIATDDEGETNWQKYYGTDGWDKSWPAIRARGGGYVLAGQTNGNGAQAKDGWLVKIGENETDENETDRNETDQNESDGETTDQNETSENEADEAVQGETATAADGPEGGVPGFGIGAALLAFAGLLLALRQ